MSGERPEVGSMGEEAVKLLKVLQDWAGENGADATASAASAAHRIDEHIATGGQDCTYCPVCQAISFLRTTRPEVREHLTSAATSLLHAATALLAPPPTDRRPDDRPEDPVERIRFDEGADDEWEDD